MVTTLDLLGLMNKSHKNLVRELLGVKPYLTPFLRGLFKPLLKEGMKLSVFVYVLKNLSCVLFIKLVDH
jgi:hypothetical protein